MVAHIHNRSPQLVYHNKFGNFWNVWNDTHDDNKTGEWGGFLIMSKYLILLLISEFMDHLMADYSWGCFFMLDMLFYGLLISIFFLYIFLGTKYHWVTSHFPWGTFVTYAFYWIIKCHLRVNLLRLFQAHLLWILGLGSNWNYLKEITQCSTSRRDMNLTIAYLHWETKKLPQLVPYKAFQGPLYIIYAHFQST